VLGRGEESRVCDGRFGDVGAEVFDGGGSVAAGLDVYAPVFRPGRRIGLPAEFADSGTEVGPKPPLHGEERGEEVCVPDPDKVPLRVESPAGDEVVDVGVEVKSLVPGVEDPGEAMPGRAGSIPRGESLAEGAGTGGEEQVEGLLCHLSKEEPAQLLRQGEGDEEVGGRQTPVELSRHPLRGGSAAALGAGAVVAAVVDEAARGALRADMEVPSHGRGAAMGDGPDGASPRLVAGREPRGKLRQE